MQTIENLLNSKIIYSIMVVFLIFYGPRLAPRLSDKLHNYFKNPLFRFIIIFSILYLATRHLDKGFFDSLTSQEKVTGNGRLVLIIMIIFFVLLGMKKRAPEDKLLYNEQFTERGTPNGLLQRSLGQINKWIGHSISDTLAPNRPNRLNTLDTPQSPSQTSPGVAECLSCPSLNDNDKSLISDFYDAEPQHIDTPQEPVVQTQGTDKKLWDGSVGNMNEMRSYQ